MKEFPYRTGQNMRDGVKRIIEEALAEFDEKSRDYSAKQAFGDVYAISKDLDIPPAKILYVHLSKHIAAIKRYIDSDILVSESFDSRCKDALIYFAMLAYMREIEDNLDLETAPNLPQG